MYLSNFTCCMGGYIDSPTDNIYISRAMEVLDLLFNFRFNTRLEQFVFEFKNTHEQANSPTAEMPEIGEFIAEYL